MDIKQPLRREFMRLLATSPFGRHVDRVVKLSYALSTRPTFVAAMNAAAGLVRP